MLHMLNQQSKGFYNRVALFCRVASLTHELASCYNREGGMVGWLDAE